MTAKKLYDNPYQTEVWNAERKIFKQDLWSWIKDKIPKIRINNLKHKATLKR